jgi:DNA gyrase subunit A
MGRNASGVRGITLANAKDEVVGMVCLTKEKKSDILVVSENGYGKRSDIDDYRITNRGGKGVKTINITDKTGNLIAIKDVTDNDDLMIINRSGIIIRMAVGDLRIVGRATQGVRLIKINEGDSIAAVTKVEVDEDQAASDIEDGIVIEGEEINGEEQGESTENIEEKENN